MKANVVLVNKFRPGNILNYAEFFTYVVSLHPRRLVFTDEKMFKAEEGYLKIGRRDPLTGEQPTQVVDSDFRNRYCIMGMCSMNKTKIEASHLHNR